MQFNPPDDEERSFRATDYAQKTEKLKAKELPEWKSPKLSAEQRRFADLEESRERKIKLRQENRALRRQQREILDGDLAKFDREEVLQRLDTIHHIVLNMEGDYVERQYFKESALFTVVCNLIIIVLLLALLFK
jgi:hypothetical protein